MDLHVETERFSEMRYFHGSGNAEVILGIGAHEISRIIDDEVGLRLKTTYVLRLQQGGFDEVA